MLTAFKQAQEQLDNYKQVEKEWNMETPATPVKRKRGNPNFVKKNPTPEAEQLPTLPSQDPARPESSVKMVDVVTEQVYRYQYVESEADVWLKLYSALLGTYATTGPATIRLAAQNADAALTEYNSRYKKWSQSTSTKS